MRYPKFHILSHHWGSRKLCSFSFSDIILGLHVVIDIFQESDGLHSIPKIQPSQINITLKSQMEGNSHHPLSINKNAAFISLTGSKEYNYIDLNKFQEITCLFLHIFSASHDIK